MFRLRRSVSSGTQLNEKPIIVDDKSGQSLAEFFDQEYKKSEQVKRSVALFTDRVGFKSIFIGCCPSFKVVKTLSRCLKCLCSILFTTRPLNAYYQVNIVASLSYGIKEAKIYPVDGEFHEIGNSKRQLNIFQSFSKNPFSWDG